MLGDKLKEIMRVKGVDCRELSNSSEVPLETIRNLYYGKVTDPKVYGYSNQKQFEPLSNLYFSTFRAVFGFLQNA